jgi:hypothetical protein
VSHRLPLDRHAVPALLLVVVALLAAFALGGRTTEVTGSTTSTSSPAGGPVARAANVDEPVGAPDRRWPVGGQAMQAALGIAAQQWGGTPCGGQIALSWTPLEPGTNATASWRNPTHAWDNPSANFDCRIELSPAADYDWRKFCTVVVHEVGHLAGRQHAGDPDDVMAAVYRAPLPACSATPEPGAPAAAPRAATPQPRLARRAAARRTTARRTTGRRRAARRARTSSPNRLRVGKHTIRRGLKHPGSRSRAGA